MEPFLIKLERTELDPETKGKLYVIYGAEKQTTFGKTDLYHGVQIKNVEEVLKKCRLSNINKVLFRPNNNPKSAFVLYVYNRTPTEI